MYNCRSATSEIEIANFMWHAIFGITTASSEGKYGFHRSVSCCRHLPRSSVKAHGLKHRASSVAAYNTFHLAWQTCCCKTAVGCIIWHLHCRAHPAGKKVTSRFWLLAMLQHRGTMDCIIARHAQSHTTQLTQMSRQCRPEH